MSPPPPLMFSLTEEEGRIAAARAAWRGALAGGLVAPHLAPLTAFALWTGFAAILGFTALIERRGSEVAIIAGAAAYMMYRLWTRRRLFGARRAAIDWAERVRAAGDVRITLGETGLALAGAAPLAQWLFAEGLEVENAGGMIYVWPRAGFPAFWPARVHADAEDCDRYFRYFSARGASVSRPAPAPPQA